MLNFRLAKPCDYKDIAKLHYNNENSTNGFFSNVGLFFLRKYYKLLLNDKYSIVLCGLDKNQSIVGFASGSLDCEEQFNMFRRNKLALFFSLLPDLIFKPSLLYDLILRYRSTVNKSDKNVYVNSTGARGEFWFWDSKSNNSIMAGILNNNHLNIIHLCGVNVINFEVDSINSSVYDYSIKNGAVHINTFSLPDGRVRYLMSYDLKEKFYKRKSKYEK